MKRGALLFLFLIFSVSLVWGQLLLVEFDRANSEEAVSTVSWVTTDLSANTISRSSGLTHNTGGDYNSKGFGESFDADDYITFSMTPENGKILSISEIKIRLDRSNTGPTNWVLRSNIDNFVTNLYNEDNLSSSGTTYTIPLAISNLNSTIEFRVFAWGATSTSGTFDVEGFTGVNLPDPGIQITGTLDAPTPVTLTSFTAVQFQNDMATVMWETASESNMSCFNLYRDQLQVSSVGATNTSETHRYSVQDQELEAGQTYNYYLEAVEYDGHTETFGPIVLSICEEVDPEEPPAVDIEATLLQGNYPNPFNPQTNIKFAIDEEEEGILEIFNAKGQLLESAVFESGEHSFNWNANDYTSGIYFYKLRTQSYNKTKKMILLK